MLVNYTWNCLSLLPLIIALSVLLTSFSPHPALLLGLLLFPGRYVRPDHVGDAAHIGWLCAEVQRPCSQPRLVSLKQQEWEETASISLWYSYSHQWDAVTIMHYITAALYRPVLKSLPVWYQQWWCFPSGCALVSLAGRIYLCAHFVCLCCSRFGDSSKFIGYLIQQIRPT